MTEYDLHTQGARHSFEPAYDGSDPCRNYDAISVQLCRDAGLDDTKTRALLSRLKTRADAENARLREELRKHREQEAAIGAGGVALVRCNECERLREALRAILERPISSILNMDAHNMRILAFYALTPQETEK